jgi:N-acetylmuramoyl-L-alanine amidase
VSALAAALLVASALTAPGSLTVASSRGQRVVPVRVDRGWPAVAPFEFGDVLSIEAAPVAAGSAEIRAAGRRFEFVLDAAYFRFGSRLFPLVAAPYAVGDTLFVPLQWLVEYLPRLVGDRFRYDAALARLTEVPPAPATGAQVAATDSVPSPRGAARTAARPAPLRREHIVAIDPGHGGRDVGMVGPIGRKPFLLEKDVTLAVSRDLAAELRRRGIGVVLTRSTDTLISLQDRGRIAGESGADVFVSIHVNAANPRWRDAKGARGFETYFLAEARTEDARRVAAMENASVRFETDAAAPSGDPMSFILNDLAQNEHLRESSRLATMVERALAKVHPSEARGVKQAGFAVLATSYMPAVLVELGFGSNVQDARYLTSASGQRRLARAVADALVAYLADYDRRLVGVTTAGQP